MAKYSVGFPLYSVKKRNLSLSSTWIRQALTKILSYGEEKHVHNDVQDHDEEELLVPSLRV